MLCRFLVLSTLALFAGLPTQLDGAFMARSTGCLHNGTRYADKSMVPTTEKCLSCVCNKKNLACRLKVCPEMPMPPPRGCVVVQKKNTCCPYLSCARLDAFYKIPTSSRIIAYLDHYERESIDRVVNDNMLQRRSDDSDVDLYVCVKNGTVYKSGSAMSSSNLCSYCYCIGGTEKCVKPKCMLPVDGCKPIFVDSACCPVRYDCNIKASGKSSQESRYRKTSNKHFLRMSQRLQRNRGCMSGKQFYVEGQKMKSDDDRPCDICFCIRGTRRCAPKKCAPALKNCMPVVPRGQCCPSSYDCGSQRDYRRAQSSRQFNLFSLIFGPEEGEAGNNSYAASQYPHDRLPGPATHRVTPPTVASSSEKSIFDTLREGLEFIDQNNKILEDDTELRNFSRSTVKPNISPTPTTEVSLLDLLLGPAEESQSASTESTTDDKPTTSVGGFSWVDLLLGSDEDEKKTVTEEITEKLSHTTASQEYDSSTSIDRLDEDFDDFSGSGEIHVGELWATQPGEIEETTIFEDSSTELSSTSNTTELHEQSTEESSTTEVTPSSSEVATPTKSEMTPQTLVQQVEKTISGQHEGHPARNKTIESKEDPQQNLHKPQTLTLTESVAENGAKNSTGGKPSSGGILSAFLDGITDMLKTERPLNRTESRVKPNSTDTQISKTIPTRKPPLPLSTLSPKLPSSRPVPTLRTRINSKIANLTLVPFVQTTKQALNGTLGVMHVEHKNITTTNTSLNVLTNKTTPSNISTSVPTTSTSVPITSTSVPTTSTRAPAPTTSISASTKANAIATTENPKIIPLTTTSRTTPKTMYVKTNPTILDAEPLDASNDPTLPPSLPNLKIIPFLPTDAVQTDRKQNLYEFYHSISESGGGAPPVGSTMAPALLVDGHWDTLADKNSKMDYIDPYDEGKMYPSITEPYQTYAEFGDASKAEYIYKFKIEGPSSSVSSNEGKLDGSKSSAAFAKFDFGSSGPQMSGGFSPPTKTEGGFLPKEPLEIEAGEGVPPKLAPLERYQVTPHIIDITTSEPMKDSTTKVIEITTPDPFKDVIKTESPPDLISLIEDKQKIILAQKMHPIAENTTQAYEENIIVHITTELPEVMRAPMKPNTTALSLDDMILKDKSSIESFLDLLFKEEELELEPTAHLTTTRTSTTTTIPPFKSLPQTVMMGYYNDPLVTSESSSSNTSSTTTKPSPSKRVTATTKKVTSTTTVRSKVKSKTSSTKPPSSGSQEKVVVEKLRPLLVESPASSALTGNKSYARTTTTTTSTTSTPTSRTPTRPKTITTSRPILMAPFDKLPFMDASFEVRPNAASSTPHRTTDSFLGLVHYKNSLNKIEGLEPAYEVDPLNIPSQEEHETGAESSSSSLSAAPFLGTSTTSTTSTTSAALPTSQHSASNTLTDLSGILKLAGCNIYGRMYRVGRIILELSSACLECRCTEIGVKCGPLDC